MDSKTQAVRQDLVPPSAISQQNLNADTADSSAESYPLFDILVENNANARLNAIQKYHGTTNPTAPYPSELADLSTTLPRSTESELPDPSFGSKQGSPVAGQNPGFQPSASYEDNNPYFTNYQPFGLGTHTQTCVNPSDLVLSGPAPLDSTVDSTREPSWYISYDDHRQPETPSHFLDSQILTSSPPPFDNESVNVNFQANHSDEHISLTDTQTSENSGDRHLFQASGDLDLQFDTIVTDVDDVPRFVKGYESNICDRTACGHLDPTQISNLSPSLSQEQANFGSQQLPSLCSATLVNSSLDDSTAIADDVDDVPDEATSSNKPLKSVVPSGLDSRVEELAEPFPEVGRPSSESEVLSGSAPDCHNSSESRAAFDLLQQPMPSVESSNLVSRQCPNCNFKPTGQSNPDRLLRRHVQRKHSQDKYSQDAGRCPCKKCQNGGGHCRYCNNGFTRVDNIQKHIKHGHCSMYKRQLQQENQANIAMTGEASPFDMPMSPGLVEGTSIVTLPNKRGLDADELDVEPTVPTKRVQLQQMRQGMQRPPPLGKHLSEYPLAW